MTLNDKRDIWRTALKAVGSGLLIIFMMLMLKPADARYVGVINKPPRACIGEPWILNGQKVADKLTTEEFQLFMGTSRFTYKGTAEVDSKMWNKFNAIEQLDDVTDRAMFKYVDFFSHPTAKKFDEIRYIIWGDYQGKTCIIAFGEVSASGMGMAYTDDG